MSIILNTKIPLSLISLKRNVIWANVNKAEDVIQIIVFDKALIASLSANYFYTSVLVKMLSALTSTTVSKQWPWIQFAVNSFL